MAYPVKPMRGGTPLNGLYRRLASSPEWVCEAKLDGVRAFWDGEELWSRTGNKLPRCEEVKKHLPRSLQLDGELVYGKDNEPTRYWVFDFAGPKGFDRLAAFYTDRRAVIADLLKALSPACGDVVKLTPYVTWDDVERLGLEGVVFKRKDSLYEMAHRPGVKVPYWVKFRRTK
jgi:ATP-dependent DNA ligase